MPELTRAERKAEEVRQKMKISMVSISPRAEAAAAVAAVTAEEKKDHNETLAQLHRTIAELEQKIVDLEGAEAKISTGHEEQLEEKDAAIEKLQAQLLESKNMDLEAVIKEQETRIASLEKVKEENKQLQLDLDLLRKTAEYDQKMLQEALNSAETNLIAKVEDNGRLRTKLVDLLSKLQMRSKITKALSELDNDIADLSDQGIIMVPDSSKPYQTCHTIDVDKIEESLKRLHTEQRDDFSVEEAEVEVETTMTKLAKVMACGDSLPLCAE
ncbi:hypothetical protein ACHAWT_008123 [Skeletonema menzelii]